MKVKTLNINIENSEKFILILIETIRFPLNIE